MLAERLVRQFARANTAVEGSRLPLLTALAGVVAMLLSRPSWHEEPIDYSTFAAAGRPLLAGRLSQVYAHASNQGGPWQLLSAAALHRVLPGGDDVLLIRTLGAALLVVAGVTGTVLLRRRLGLSAAPALALAIGLAVLVWEVPGYALDGHAAELAIPAFWVAAGLAARAGHDMAAAALIGLSSGWESWGLLALAVLVLAQTPWRRLALSGVLAVGVGVAIYAPFVATGSFRMFDYRWTIGAQSLLHLLGEQGDYTWWMRLVQAGSAVTAGVLVALRLRTSVHALWLVPFVLCEVRLLLDPLTSPYYDVVPQLLAMIGVALLGSERLRIAFVVVAILYVQVAYTASIRVVTLLLSLALSGVLLAWLRQTATASAKAPVPAGR